MIKGMTGFGRASIHYGQTKGCVEIRSVNHRYMDIAYFLPSGFAFAESKIKEILQKKISRGRLTVSLKIMDKPQSVVGFNKEAARAYLRQAKTLRNDLHLKGNLSLTEIIQLPGVVELKETAMEPEKLWPAIQQGVHKALQSVVTMRTSEGKSLGKDIRILLKHMSLQIKRIQKRAREIAQARKKVLKEDELLSFLKSSDINEEISRLVHHIEEFKGLIQQDGAVGKKLDFIAQEMQRETNTMGSKLPDRIVSKAVIALKTEIEKLREQAQNIE
ncbi:MAG: YicC/YloC family endoribonuclease [Candidatus Omnitrophota bacterium]